MYVLVPAMAVCKLMGKGNGKPDDQSFAIDSGSHTHLCRYAFSPANISHGSDVRGYAMRFRLCPPCPADAFCFFYSHILYRATGRRSGLLSQICSGYRGRYVQHTELDANVVANVSARPSICITQHSHVHIAYLKLLDKQFVGPLVGTSSCNTR
jgi:hypothetical protein